MTFAPVKPHTGMLRLKQMALSEVPVVVPLFLDASQTQFWEGGQRHDGESAGEMLRGYFRHPSHHWMMYWNAEVAGYGHLLKSDFLQAWIVSVHRRPEVSGARHCDGVCGGGEALCPERRHREPVRVGPPGEPRIDSGD
ncbi:MAG: hypothetical protein R3F13_19455 [Prosthecobacter sp.]